MSRWGLAALAVGVAACRACLAAEAPDYQSESENWGRLARIVRPEYPAEALARGQAGNVELRGKIRPDGFLDEIELVPDTPAASIFVEALQPLVRNWLFVPSTGNDCQPILSRVKATVSFEVEDGKPHIFVTHQPRERSAAPGPKASSHFKPTRRIQPQYPYMPLARNVMADVFTRIEVDRSGKVVDVKARAYTPQVGVRESWLDAFTREAESTLARWEFPPVPDSEKAPWVGCYTLKFRIRD